MSEQNEHIEQTSGEGKSTAKHTAPRPRSRIKNGRHEICRECGLSWNISRNTVIPASGYLCPRCWGNQFRRKH